MKILAFYTASDPASVALRTERGELARALERGRQVERLIPVARDLLWEAGLDVGEFDGVAVARGPGSFTGLRVGAGAALGLARAAGVTLYAVGTLEVWAALAFARSDPTAACRVVLDARRGEIYLAGFRAGAREGESAPGKSWAPPELFDGPHVLPAREVLSRLEPCALVVGDGRELLVARGLEPTRAGFAEPPEPLALALARLAASSPEHYACTLESFALEYLREPQAAALRMPATTVYGQV